MNPKDCKYRILHLLIFKNVSACTCSTFPLPPSSITLWCVSGVGRGRFSFIGVNESPTLLLMNILLILQLLLRRFVVVVGSLVFGRFAFYVILKLLIDVRRRVVKSADVCNNGLAFYFDRMRQNDLAF